MGLTAIEKQKLAIVKARRVNAPPLHFRTFVHVKNGHDKFWKVAVAGNRATINYGANGTDGRWEFKEFNWNWEAVQYVQGKIREKLGKGYQEL